MTTADGVVLIANAAAASLLYRNRVGSVQAKSAWVAARNDTLGNLCVVSCRLRACEKDELARRGRDGCDCPLLPCDKLALR